MKASVFFIVLFFFVETSFAGSNFLKNGQYICQNTESYLVDSTFTKKLQVIANDTGNTSLEIGNESISLSYGPAGFKQTTNYWGEWKSIKDYDMFLVNSSNPKSPLNWDMMLIAFKNSPIIARRVDKGFRAFQYQCKSLTN